MTEFLESKSKKSKIYWLPNAFTTLSLFAGFYSIVQAMNNDFLNASIAIFVAMLFDVLDGRIARLTKTESSFGAQYDSLSDMVSFGVAPALIIYEWELYSLGKIGWLASFTFCGCAALRLARFNANIFKVEKNFFQGLPSPAAAAFLASYVLFCEVENFQINIHTELLWCFAVFASLSMVSNIPYFSGKQFNYRKTVPFSVIVLISFGVVFGIQLLETLPEILFLLSSIYVLSGYLFKLRSFFKKSS